MGAVAPLLRGETEDEKGAERIRETVSARQKTEFKSFLLGDPKNSQVPQTPIAVELYNEAIKLFQEGELELSKEMALDSIHLDSRNPLSFELVGDIYNVEHNLTEAKEYFKSAYLLQPSTKLREKIERINRESSVDESFETQETEHFIIKDKGRTDFPVLKNLSVVLESIYGDIAETMGHTLKSKVVVLLYSPSEFQRILETPHWVGGLYDGKIRLPAYQKGMSEETLQSMVAHEMAHAFVRDVSDGKAPPWINEGVAEYFERKHLSEGLIVFNAAIRTGDVIALDQLMTEGPATKQVRDPLFENLFYEQSFHLTNYLIEKNGMFEVKNLLRKFSKSQNSDEALGAAFGMTTQELEKEWRTTFTKP